MVGVDWRGEEGASLEIPVRKVLSETCVGVRSTARSTYGIQYKLLTFNYYNIFKTGTVTPVQQLLLYGGDYLAIKF